MVQLLSKKPPQGTALHITKRNHMIDAVALQISPKHLELIDKAIGKVIAEGRLHHGGHREYLSAGPIKLSIHIPHPSNLL